METCHLLFTRFNLRIPDQEVNIDQWTEERFTLFEQYTLPSVNGQVFKSFQWVLFFDEATIEKHKDKIASLLQNNDNFHVFYFPGIEAFKQGWRAAIAHLIPPKTSFITTTSLDNDDAIHSKFLYHVSQNAKNKSLKATNFENGLLLEQNVFANLLEAHQKSNAFITIQDKLVNGEYKSVYDGKHKLWAAKPYYRSIVTQDPLWLQVIHGSNLANKPIGKPSTHWELLLNFQLDTVNWRKENYRGLGHIRKWGKYLQYWQYKLRGKL